MRFEIVRRPTAEEAELSRRKLELSALRARLVKREHALDDLRAQLLSFEGRYIRQVGKLYVQLDEWEKKIAELDAGLVIPEGAEKAAPTEAPSLDDALLYEAADAGTIFDLKTAFRELARRVHPDYAADADDALQRTRLMAQANDAFRRNDADMLQRMLNGHTGGCETATPAAELARVLAQLARMDRDIDRIDRQVQALGDSGLAHLRERAIAAAAEGRDLLAEMAARVKGSIGMAMRRYELDLVRKKRKEAAFDPTSYLSAERTAPPAHPGKR